MSHTVPPGSSARRRLEASVADEAAMLELGAVCGRAVASSGPLSVQLEGALGAGKTTLARGWLKGMGYSGRVKSPTYTLMEPYEIDDREVMHLDLYRLADPEELEFLGLRDMSGGTVTLLVEWPEKGAGHLPPADLCCRIRYEGDGRRVDLIALSDTGETWLDAMESQTALQ